DLPGLSASAIGWGREIARRGRSPIVLLDDVEQLDAVSLALVRRMVSSENAGVFRWVWASARPRSGEAPPGGVLREAGLAEEMALGPLDRELSDRLLATRLQSAPPVEVADAVWQRCGGHPAWTVEALRVATHAGAIRETERGLTLDREALDRVAWPGDLEEAFRRRLAGLEPAAHAAAAALAVWGAPARAAELAGIEPGVDGAALAALHAAALAA